MADTRVEIIRRLARKGAGAALHRALTKTRAEDIARAITHLAPEQQRLVMGHIEDEAKGSDILTALEETDLVELAQSLPFDRLIAMLEQMEVDDEADIIDLLPEELRQRVLDTIKDQDKEMVEDLLSWPEDSAGGIMQPMAFRLNEDLTCRDAIKALHDQHDQLEMVFYLYVENEADHLVGVTSLRALLTHSPSTPLSAIMSSDIISVAPSTDQEEVARIVSRYDLLAIPVVDEHRRMLGIITIDDVVDVIKEEAVEDMLLMAGVGDELQSGATAFQAARQRLIWLSVTLIGGIGMAELIGIFEDVLASKAILAGFIPVMLGMGGNVGIQAATIAVRDIATGHTDTRGVGYVLFREVKVGLLLGLVFAVVLGGYASIRWMNEIPLMGVAIAISISATVISSAALGTSVPITLNRLGIDPAVATGPFVTTGIDVVAILIYFSTAVFILGV